MRNSESDAYGESNSHIHADSYTNGDGDSYVYSDSDCDGNCHIHSDGDCDGHGDSNCDRITAAYTDAATSADTAASSLALFRLRGNSRERTREFPTAGGSTSPKGAAELGRRRRAGGQGVFTSTRGFAPIAPSTSSSRKLLLYTCD